MPVAEAVTVITLASQEWWKRPDNECYLTLHSLYDATRARAEESEARTIVNDSLLVRGSAEAGGHLYLEHDDLGALDPPTGAWANSRQSPTPQQSGSERSPPVPTGPAIAAHAINLGLRRLADRAQVQVMKLPAGLA